MGKKVPLPLFVDPAASPEEKKDVPPKKPSIEAARARLGGRITERDAPPGLAPGVIVSYLETQGRRLPGVVIFASTAEVHVLLDSIRLRRFKPNELAAHEGELEIQLEKIAGDARLFGRLVEGEAVRYADEGGVLIDGRVAEKCRWGALVVRDDGSVVAVGFRKLWPSPEGTSA